MDNVQKLEEDVLEAEAKLMDKLIEQVDILSDDYIRMSLMQMKLGREIVFKSKMIAFHKKYSENFMKK